MRGEPNASGVPRPGQSYGGAVLATVVHADCQRMQHDFLSIMNEDQEGAAGGMEEEFTIDI